MMNLTGDGEKRFNACWRYFNPPRRFINISLQTYIPMTQQQREALEICKRYSIDDIKKGTGILLFGSYGTGKTHLAIGTVRHLMEQNPGQFGVKRLEETIYNPDLEEYLGFYCSFFSVVDLLDAMRPGKEAKQRYGEWLFHRAKADDLIVLDDIGSEKPTDWVEERLYAIIDIRYRMQRATVFTTNCKKEQLQSQLGGRIVSRIFEMTEQVPVIGPDHRRKMA